MSDSLKDALQARNDTRYQEKIAALEDVFSEDARALEVFDAAIDLVKEAGVTDRFQLIDDAIELTMLALDKEAAADADAEAPADETAGEEKTASIDYSELGAAAAQVAHAAGITSDEVEKLASDDENEALGRLLAHCVWAELQPTTGA